MSNVVSLRQEPMVWVCICGCSTFHALSDGTGECAACNRAHDFEGSGWLKCSDDRVFMGEEVFRDIQGNGSIEFARRRVAAMAAVDDAAAVFVLRTNGEINTWSNVETAEQAEWVERRIADAAALVKQRFTTCE